MIRRILAAVLVGGFGCAFQIQQWQMQQNLNAMEQQRLQAQQNQILQQQLELQRQEFYQQRDAYDAQQAQQGFDAFNRGLWGMTPRWSATGR